MHISSFMSPVSPNGDLPIYGRGLYLGTYAPEIYLFTPIVKIFNFYHSGKTWHYSILSCGTG